MIIKYDSDNNCTIYTCDVCGHIYHEYYDYEKEMHNDEKPFIKLEEPLLRTITPAWEPNRIERVSQYACPHCGVLQVDTRSI
jgi:rubredoxin